MFSASPGRGTGEHGCGGGMRKRVDVKSDEEEEDVGSSEGDVEKLSPCLQ